MSLQTAEHEHRPVAIVTGASSGIGLATVHSLLSRGFHVVATMRDLSRAPEALTANPSSNLSLEPLDVTSDESIAHLAAWLRDDRNVMRCDVVVNNAGFGVPGTVETVPLEAAMRIFDVNVWGVVRVCKAIIPIMRERRRGGLIVTVSSTGGVRALPCADFYAASKFAVEGLMESLRYSVAQDNIKVVLANPGPVSTKFMERYAREAKEITSVSEATGVPRVKMMADHFAENLHGIIRAGQDEHSCGESIADVVEREYQKDIADGKTSVHFWNGTSEFARSTIAAVKCDPTGNEATPYVAMWKSARNFEQKKLGEIKEDLAPTSDSV